MYVPLSVARLFMCRIKLFDLMDIKSSTWNSKILCLPLPDNKTLPIRVIVCRFAKIVVRPCRPTSLSAANPPPTAAAPAVAATMTNQIDVIVFFFPTDDHLSPPLRQHSIRPRSSLSRDVPSSRRCRRHAITTSLHLSSVAPQDSPGSRNTPRRQRRCHTLTSIWEDVGDRGGGGGGSRRQHSRRAWHVVVVVAKIYRIVVVPDPPSVAPPHQLTWLTMAAAGRRAVPVEEGGGAVSGDQVACCQHQKWSFYLWCPNTGCTGSLLSTPTPPYEHEQGGQTQRG
jgi:hypothetical protein